MPETWNRNKLPDVPKRRLTWCAPEEYLTHDDQFDPDAYPGHLFTKTAIASAAGYRDTRYLFGRVLTDTPSLMHLHQVWGGDLQGMPVFLTYATLPNSAEAAGKALRARTKAKQARNLFGDGKTDPSSGSAR